MPLLYKLDVLSALKEVGYTTYQIRKNKLLSESTVQKLREGKPISWENIETLCKLLNCQPNDIIEYIPDSDRPPRSFFHSPYSAPSFLF